MCEQDKNKMLEKYLKDSSKFNAFKIFKCCENQHSDFLAYLLNPNENHGLSKTFLIEFLEKIPDKNDEIINKIKHEKEEDICVYREFVTNEDGRKAGRIDILITGKTFACVFENKFGSKQHGNQCEKYKEFINKLGNKIPKKYIYIDLDDSKYKKEAELKDYTLVKYKDIREIIEAILQSDITQNAYTQNILKQYIICLDDKYAADFGLTKELKNLAEKLKDKLDNCELRKNKNNEPYSLIIKSEKIKDCPVNYVIDLDDGLIFKVCITFKSKKIEYPYKKILLNYDEFSKLLCAEEAVKEAIINKFIYKYNSFIEDEFEIIKKNVNEFVNKL